MLLKEQAEKPAEYKTIPAFGFKAKGDQGIVEHLVSVFGVLDLGMDITEPGAFTRTLKDRAGLIRVLDQHHKERIGDVLGVPVSLKEVGRDELPAEVLEKYPEATGGLLAETQFLIDTPEGSGAYKRLRSKAVSEFSFAYNAVKVRFSKKDDGAEVRHLEDVELFEYSPVLFAMNPAAAFISAKDAEGNDEVTVPPDPVVHLLEKADFSITKTVENLNNKFDEAFNPDSAEGYRTWRYWIKEIFDTYIIVRDNDEGEFFKVAYTFTGEAEDAKFASENEWVPGEYVFVEKQGEGSESDDDDDSDSDPPENEEGKALLRMLTVEIEHSELVLALEVGQGIPPTST